MSADASVINKPNRKDRVSNIAGGDLFASPNMPFVPAGDAFLSRVEPGAIGSMLVLLSLIGALGFGGYSILQEVQRVQVAPVDQLPVVLADLDPLNSAFIAQSSTETSSASSPQVSYNPRENALDRLYRPQALEVPILVARDAPIANIDPRLIGSFTAPVFNDIDSNLIAGINGALAEANGVNVPQVIEGPVSALQMVAAYPSWVRVRSAEGAVIFEGIMEKGDTWTVPSTIEPATLRTGESGAIYFAIAGDCYGPAGAPGSVTSNLPLVQAALVELFEPAPLSSETTLGRMVADLSAIDQLAAVPCQAN
jgi:hypothetical protein